MIFNIITSKKIKKHKLRLIGWFCVLAGFMWIAFYLYLINIHLSWIEKPRQRDYYSYVPDRKPIPEELRNEGTITKQRARELLEIDRYEERRFYKRITGLLALSHLRVRMMENF